MVEKSKLNNNDPEYDADDLSMDDVSDQESIENPSYEELFDKNEELEASLLRLKADLDNALKRSFSEVEKAHKYGIEKLLIELLPVIDNLENALTNISSKGLLMS